MKNLKKSKKNIGKNTIIIDPEIFEYYDHHLLSKPLRTVEEKLKELLTYILHRLWYRASEEKIVKCQKLLDKYYEIEKKIKAQKKENAETKKISQGERPFYSIRASSRRGNEILERLKRRAVRFSSKAK